MQPVRHVLEDLIVNNGIAHGYIGFQMIRGAPFEIHGRKTKGSWTPATLKSQLLPQTCIENLFY